MQPIGDCNLFYIDQFPSHYLRNVVSILLGFAFVFLAFCLIVYRLRVEKWRFNVSNNTHITLFVMALGLLVLQILILELTSLSAYGIIGTMFDGKYWGAYQYYYWASIA